MASWSTLSTGAIVAEEGWSSVEVEVGRRRFLVGWERVTVVCGCCYLRGMSFWSLWGWRSQFGSSFYTYKYKHNADVTLCLTMPNNRI